MAARTCEEVLMGLNFAEDGTTGKKVTRSSSQQGDSGDFLDAVIKEAGNIRTAAMGLYEYDCSEHLLEWLYSACPALKTASKDIDRISKNIGSITSGIKLGELIQGNDFTKEFCNLVVTVFGSVNAFLEVISKAAFALFDKIDTAREKLQQSLKLLTDAVQECILDVYDMIDKYLGGLLKVTLNWNWEALEKLLIDCPCICRFVSYVTGCDRDEDGNSISDQPDLVIRCIRDKFWYMDGINLATGLSAIMDTYIKQYVILFFDMIKLSLDSFFTVLVMPLRWLIKQYADLLRKKMDVSFLLEPLRTSHMDCLLVYTREEVDGKMEYRMSVLDMMESMKMWVNCLEHACPALTERIKNKVKQYNEEFRLSGEYWNRAFEADIYLCCMRADSAYENGYSLEDLANMWDDLFDRLRAANDRVKSKVYKAKWTYGLYPSSTGGIQYYTEDMRGEPETGSVGEAAASAVTAVQFAGSIDNENNLQPGIYPLSDREDRELRSMGLSLADGMREDAYFGEKWAQFIRFLGFYAFSDETLNALKEASEKGSTSTGASREGSGIQVRVITVREPVEDDEESSDVNYWVDSDYDQGNVDAISNIEWTERRSNESLAAYYARMYSTAV